MLCVRVKSDFEQQQQQLILTPAAMWVLPARTLGLGSSSLVSLALSISDQSENIPRWRDLKIDVNMMILLRSWPAPVADTHVPVSLRGPKLWSFFVIGSQGPNRSNKLASLRSFPCALCPPKGDLWLAGLSLEETLMAPGLAMWDPFMLFIEHHRAQRIGCADLTQPFLTRRKDSRGSRKALEDIATYML
jgi:hypothetical protein